MSTGLESLVLQVLGRDPQHRQALLSPASSGKDAHNEAASVLTSLSGILKWNEKREPCLLHQAAQLSSASAHTQEKQVVGFLSATTGLRKLVVSTFHLHSV